MTLFAQQWKYSSLCWCQSGHKKETFQYSCRFHNQKAQKKLRKRNLFISRELRNGYCHFFFSCCLCTYLIVLITGHTHTRTDTAFYIKGYVHISLLKHVWNVETIVNIDAIESLLFFCVSVSIFKKSLSNINTVKLNHDINIMALSFSNDIMNLTSWY